MRDQFYPLLLRIGREHEVDFACIVKPEEIVFAARKQAAQELLILFDFADRRSHIIPVSVFFKKRQIPGPSGYDKVKGEIVVFTIVPGVFRYVQYQ